MTIEDMENELIAAGYAFVFKDGHSRAIAPNDWRYEDSFSASEKPSFIPRVYAHLQQSRRLAALEDFVTQVAESYKHNSDELGKLVDKARELQE